MKTKGRSFEASNLKAFHPRMLESGGGFLGSPRRKKKAKKSRIKWMEVRREGEMVVDFIREGWLVWWCHRGMGVIPIEV